LIAIVGAFDMIKMEAPEAVERFKNAGINVIMVTSDNSISSKIIAKECNIIPRDADFKDNRICMEGYEFYQIVGGVYCRLCKQ
jgi:magnesium-transporting ATPase (P-type)